ncbi:thioredoxin domain-containing protein [Symbiobacterium terraclitae]|uniref:thioredoxin domain-containing protein n=1 Tax=Symbiobacterium terraclitae TaxID=557451 RepID=UPI0035B530BA
MIALTARPNRLIHEASPYLQQHAHNPVDWYPWGSEALERARKEDKPIFLSIGYSSCHWCHVMERESFDDPEIAAIMNQHFVCIKVDREERPDLDDIYQTICQMVTRSGGWPLSVWLTPDQKPFYVGTYFPPTERYGRPGFRQVLMALVRAWREKRSEVEQVAAQWADGIARSDALDVVTGDLPDRQLITDAARAFAARIDPRHGGFGGAPKFPNTFALELMLRHWKASGDGLYLKLVTLTLRKMAEGGIYDQLGGGFHRYSVDERWAVPHFEKMLYDNAVLPLLYIAAWQAAAEPRFRRVAEETLDYVIREMTHPDGGFYAATDADSEGEEGRFFVWDRQEIVAVLGSDLGELICRHYGVTDRGNFEHSGKTVLHIAEPPEALAQALNLPLQEVEARLAEGRRRLLEAREKRVPPFRDEKVLTAWNGLMISAMARAGRSLRRREYTDTARRAADFLLSHLADGRGGLLRRYKDGQAGIPGYLEDYACLAAGLIDLYEATFEERYLNEAIRLTEETLRRFYDGSGSFYLTQSGSEPLIHRPRDLMDASVPAGSAVAAMNLLRLQPYRGDDRFRTTAEEAFRRHRDLMSRAPGGTATMLQALDFYLSSPTEVTLVGGAPEAWLEALGRRYEPNLVLTRVDAPRDDAPIWAGKAAVGGAPTAYVCRNFACSPPATTWEELAQYLGS